jgi:hypothetical protein
MSMSKAMAAECEGVVYLMTRADLKNEEELVKTPENGIWWQVEFPSLLDESRAGGRKITKVSACRPFPQKAFVSIGIDTSHRSSTSK